MKQVLILVLALCASFAAQGCVVYWFWVWFVLPTPEGIGRLSAAQACGFVVFVRYWKIQLPNSNRPTQYETGPARMGASCITAAIALFFGWLIKVFL